MTKKVTIVMYHFVRDLKNSRYPEIKGLDLSAFTEQLEYIRKYYEPITMEDLIEAVQSEHRDLPANAILLTFDDGYIDHFSNVFPLLQKYRLQGSFFPPAKAILSRQVLDVNKIHFVLASVDDKSQIVRAVFSEIEDYTAVYGLERPETLFQKLATATRYDDAETVFIKRVLQKALPEELRAQIVDKLFAQFITGDEREFADELYVNVGQLTYMRSCGMFIGSHGYDHYWMNTLSPEKQLREIHRSLEFLGGIGCDLGNWVMCYPYGAYDESLIGILKNSGCAVGLATDVAIADIATDNHLALPRLDTNDLPKQKDAAPNEWTKQVLTQQEIPAERTLKC